MAFAGVSKNAFLRIDLPLRIDFFWRPQRLRSTESASTYARWIYQPPRSSLPADPSGSGFINHKGHIVDALQSGEIGLISTLKIRKSWNGSTEPVARSSSAYFLSLKWNPPSCRALQVRHHLLNVGAERMVSEVHQHLGAVPEFLREGVRPAQSAMAVA